MITKEYLQQELRRRIESIKPNVNTKTDHTILEMRSILVLVDALQDRVKDYDEALERAKIAYKDTDKHIKATVERIFPELRESEDERIRKALIDALKVSETIGELKFRLPYPTKEECIAYLKKQKEQKPISFNEPYNPDEYEVVMEGNATSLKRKEQKSAEWSEEDEKIRKQLISICDEWLNGGCSARPCLNDVRWLKNLLETQKALIPAEWSEEDKDMLNCCISSIEEAKENRYAYKETDGDTSYDREIAFLKSIRPHPSWKPSDEQMEGLKFFLEFHRSQRNAGTVNWREYDAIESLYEQLKKL